jgi:hypothetical protein
VAARRGQGAAGAAALRGQGAAARRGQGVPVWQGRGQGAAGVAASALERHLMYVQLNMALTVALNQSQKPDGFLCR